MSGQWAAGIEQSLPVGDRDDDEDQGEDMEGDSAEGGER